MNWRNDKSWSTAARTGALPCLLLLALLLHSCGGGSDDKDSSPAPGGGAGISASVALLNFGAVPLGTAGTPLPYTLSATGLSADLVVNAPDELEVSTDSGASWHDQINLTPVAGTVASLTVLARVKSSAGTGPLALPITHTSAGVAGISIQSQGSVDPGPRGALPAAFAALDYYFQAELVAGNFTGTNHNMPVKLAQAPDGRIFVSVLDGVILTIAGTAPFAQTVWANVPVLDGAEQGLLGIALSPDFATNGHVFVMACVAGVPDRQQIIRYTDVGGVGTSPLIIMDNIPIAQIHNSGALKFGLDGKLYATVGDANVEADAQAEGTLAGRVLRMNEDGGVPADNPLPAPNAYEFCRGLRNTFGLCVHPVTGTLVGSENGPNNNDELNFLRAGRNFEWGAATPVPAAQVGFKMRNWPTVIVPTGLTFHSGQNIPAAYGGSLFICGYDHGEVLRFAMFGDPPVNIDSEQQFIAFTPNFNANKPLDVIELNDGSLLVSTFTAIWRIYARTGP